MHSAVGPDSPMPGSTGKRFAFKSTLLVKSLELTHAFASSQGNRVSLVGGDFNMPFSHVDTALRQDLSLGARWEISDNDPNGNRDFLFAAGGDLTKLDTALLNFEGVHSLVAAAMPLPHTVPPVPRAGPRHRRSQGHRRHRRAPRAPRRQSRLQRPFAASAPLL